MAGDRLSVWVTGASSQLGVFLLPRLRSAALQVLALSRRAPRHPLEAAEGVTWIEAGLLADDENPDPGVSYPLPDYLVSCAPLDLALRLVQRHAGRLQRVVAFSSSSVLSKASSDDPAERRSMAAMAAAEVALASACAERGIPLLLLRPTLIYGCGMDRNVSLLAEFARRLGLIPLAGPAAGLRQPVHAADLADLALRALQVSPPLSMASAVCGGSTLTYREMTQRIAAVAPRSVRLLSLPEGLMVMLVRLLSSLPGSPAINAAMVKRQNRDLVFDDSALRQALDWSPRPFEPTAADFQIPDDCKSLQLPTTP